MQRENSRTLSKTRAIERGASMIDYVIMLAFIAIVSIPALKTLGQEVVNNFDAPSQCLGNGDCGDGGSGGAMGP